MHSTRLVWGGIIPHIVWPVHVTPVEAVTQSMTHAAARRILCGVFRSFITVMTFNKQLGINHCRGQH